MPTVKTTIVHPQDRALSEALRLAFIFAAVKLVLHIVTNTWEAHIGWGYFRDEMYYIACGRQLAWGYVDHGPVVALQARASEIFFGHSLVGLRLFSAAAGAARIFLTGVLAWSLGGRRPAQALAMLGVLLVPQYLGTDSYLSMNSFESLFWMTSLLALILMLRGGNKQLWLLFGVSAGLGLLNKPSMTFFLIALLVALIVTPQRRLLTNRWAVAGTALLLLIVLPNLLWQVHHDWPTLEFLRNGKLENKTIHLGPTAFVLKQVLNMGPLLALIWVAGLVRLLRRKEHRWLGLTFLLFLAVMMALQAKDYYVSPIYPILFAAGGVAWETRFAGRRSVAEDRTFAFPAFEVALIVLAIPILPMSMPLMPPMQWVRYMKATHLYGLTSNTENSASGQLPQFYADRFGWQEEVDQLTRVYHSLPADQRRITGILCDNYGEASAVHFLNPDLPIALSGHNNYFLWGSRGFTFDSMILIEGSSPEHLKLYFASVQIVGRTGTSYSMPSEHKNIYLVEGAKFDPVILWPKKKMYI